MSEDLGLSIARSLTAIVILYRDLEDEALHKFADKEMPGGDALVMLGPVANMEAYNYRQLSELMGRTNGKGGYDDPCTDDAPPLLVLASWHDVVRQERGLPDSEKRATITREADGIRASIDWMLAENEHGTPNFMPADELARDLHRVVYRLERILKAGEQRDRGAPCMECYEPLVRDYGDTRDEDRWYCRPCDAWSTIDQYNLAVRTNYLETSPTLNATDMFIQWRIKAGSLTAWATKGIVTKHGKDQNGRILYDVKQACDQRDLRDKGDDDTPESVPLPQPRYVA